MRILTIVFFAIAVLASVGSAQKPEFLLRIHFHDAHGGHGPDSLGFGYDAQATDGLDPSFGEFEYPPAIAPGGNYTAFDLHIPLTSDDTLFSGIDILPKPSVNSFSLSYTFYASAYNYPGTLSWSRADIPQSITGLRIIGSDETLLADMLLQDSVPVMIQSYQAWFPATIVLYNNMTPPSLSVRAEETAKGLLQHVSVYPNPIREQGKLALLLSEPAVVSITGYDEAGRECVRKCESVSPGPATIPLDNVNAHGSILLHIEAVGASKKESQNILVVKN